MEDLAPSFSISQIAELLRGEIIGDRDACIAPVKIHLTDSSQTVIAGRSLFVAVSGSTYDGHRFVPNACEAGALACVVDKQCQAPAGAVLIRVQDSRVALSRLAAVVCDKPAEKLRMIGVTGTNGKTSVHWILHSLLNASGIETARIGTVGKQIKSRITSSALTTPEPLELHGFLRDCVLACVDTCVMEVSSHALEQHRVEDVEFDVAVFTNLSRDHLDYHDSFESYFQAKSHLFDLLSVGGTAVIWDDSEYGRALLGKTRSLGKQALLCGTASDCDIRVADTRFSIARTSVELEVNGATIRYSIPFIGAHNVQNSVLALAAGNVCGLNWGRLASSIEYVPQIPGRLERVGEASDRGFEIFVDYAHTPDALLNALESLRGLTKGRLAVVFGCGGDRDIGKRSEMGAIAAKLADRVILTWDNPRSEDPDVILRDIQQGVDKAVELRDPAPEVSVEPDRGEAIRAGIGSLSDGDTLLIAGKGHEDYQIVGDKVRPFSDIEHTRRVLKSLKMN